MSTWTIQSGFVRAQVQSLGAMLGPAWFNLMGTELQPFAVAPWADDTGSEYLRLPNIIKRLRGEWACVPFGLQRDLGELPDEWRPASSEPEPDLVPHGRSSNEEWRCARLLSDRIELILAYPETHPVRLLRRSISASALRPQLDISLAIEVREACELPIGVHPTFRLPAAPRRARLLLDPAALAWTPPLPPEPTISRFRSDIRGVPLERVPLWAGGIEDVTRLPLPYAAEELVLATGVGGQVALQDLDGGYTVNLVWDPNVFPVCQLWLSNYGRSYYPWSSRFQAIGIEPLRAAFDLGTNVSRHRGNPLWRAGHPCTISLSPGIPFETFYSVAVA
jgi:hypothetical protein